MPGDLPAFDVAVCRNVLIYLLPEAREAVLRGLVSRLAPDGIVVLGATDSPSAGLGLRALDRPRAVWGRA
ncbi:CheR family methyltransferase [Roseomonas sp. CCTCC AB2023176]|uniref:CheR family methyltransferase n=1 Tax=Roseomonas sp. CCTCC AB2023176 TaxID=3342640 RepID=UPI0035D5AB20